MESRDNPCILFLLIDGDYYGTPKGQIVADLEKGHDVLLNLDIQGALAVKKAMPRALSVFVSPTSWDALEKRFESLMEKHITAQRLKQAHKEIISAKDFDFVVLNDNLLQAADDINAILRAERHRGDRALLSLSRLLESTPASLAADGRP